MGRPKKFNREGVLDRAIPVFWKHGFANTTLQHLEQATGVNKSGMYMEFKDKDDLFLASLERYAQTRGAEILTAQPLGWGNIERFLRLGFGCDDDQRGCFAVNSMRELAGLPIVSSAATAQRGGLNWEQSAKVFSRCSMKMRTLVDSRRLAGRTARIGTVRSKGVRRRTTVPSLSSAANSHAGAWAIPRCSRTPIRICSISLVRKTPVGTTCSASCPEPNVHGCTEPRSTSTTARKRLRSSGDSGAPYRVRY
jgi:AcrR family transcriptional regulator